VRIIVRVLSVLGIAIRGLFFLACLGASGLSDGPPEDASAWIPLLLPFAYYGYCLISSGRAFRGSLLLISGILAHLIVILFCFLAVRKGAAILVMGPLILAPCWVRMCLQKRGEPSSSQGG
jgi:hypothetical protein